MGYSVTIPALTVSLKSDLTNYQVFSLMSDLQTLDNQPGEVRVYAGGRKRLILRPGLAKSFNLNLPACTRSQINWLKQYVGQMVLVRDDRGNKVYCAYFAVPVTEWSAETDTGDVTLALSEVTNSEAV